MIAMREREQKKGEEWAGCRETIGRPEKGGFTREISLIYCCLGLSNCPLALDKESFSEAIFDSEFIW